MANTDRLLQQDSRSLHGRAGKSIWANSLAIFATIKGRELRFFND
jgi:hypothetical protein